MERINDQIFDEKVLDVGHTVVVKFTASWCAPCRVLTPILLEAQKEYPQVSFYEIDVETDKELTEDFEIQSLPTTLIFVNGQQEAEIKGVISQRVLSAVLSKYGA